MTALDHALQVTDEAFLFRGIKAAHCATVTCWADRFTHKKEGVVVAVRVHVYYFNEVAAGLAFCPECATGAAEECSLAGLAGLLVGLFVHVCYHEDFKGLAVLDYYWEKSVSVFL